MPKPNLAGEVSIEKFSWDTKEKKLVAFVSDLPNKWLERVWGDSCDLGFQVRGKREVKLFLLAHEEYDGDELVAWHLSEYGQGGWKMVVFND